VVMLPDPGKSFRLNATAGFYGDAQAIGVAGAGRLTARTALYFGVGSDTEGDEAGGKVGASFQW